MRETSNGSVRVRPRATWQNMSRDSQRVANVAGFMRSSVAEYEDKALSRCNAFLSYSHQADKKLASAIQSNLQRIGASWNELRAMHVYRDETDTPTNAALWQVIEKALSDSEYFILLASPSASTSPWVQKEVECWISCHPIKNILIVVTEGELPIWDSVVGDFLWDRNTSLPPNLAKCFTNEPKYLDLRWARTCQHLTMRNDRFYEAIADLASAVRHIDKSTLVGEDARQLRIKRRLARCVVTVLSILLLTACAAGLIAFKARNRAIEAEAVARHHLLEVLKRQIDDYIQRLDYSRVQDKSFREDPQFQLVIEAVRSHPDIRRGIIDWMKPCVEVRTVQGGRGAAIALRKRVAFYEAMNEP